MPIGATKSFAAVAIFASISTTSQAGIEQLHVPGNSSKGVPDSTCYANMETGNALCIADDGQVILVEKDGTISFCQDAAIAQDDKGNIMAFAARDCSVFLQPIPK